MFQGTRPPRHALSPAPTSPAGAHNSPNRRSPVAGLGLAGGLAEPSPRSAPAPTSPGAGPNPARRRLQVAGLGLAGGLAEPHPCPTPTPSGGAPNSASRRSPAANGRAGLGWGSVPPTLRHAWGQASALALASAMLREAGCPEVQNPVAQKITLGQKPHTETRSG